MSYVRSKNKRPAKPKRPIKPKMVEEIVIVEQPKKARAPRPKKNSSAFQDLGAMAGTALGSMVGPAGAAAGNLIGSKLGGLVSKIMGFGEYHIDNNSLMTGGVTVPQIINSVDKGGVIVRHREYLGDILATTGYAVQGFPLNPGVVTTFPWLSQMASSFEQYQLRGMIVEFVSTSSDAVLSTATNSALGTVSIATDYDVADPAPPDKRSMLNYEFSSSSKPSCSFIHPIECKKSLSTENLWYIRNSLAVPAGFDARLYDFANIFVATEGQQAAGGVLGELWISYEIEMYKQQYTYAGLIDHLETSSITAAHPFGTVVNVSAIQSSSTIGGTINAAGTSYLFPPLLGTGNYFAAYTVIATVGAAFTPPALTLTNAVALTFLDNDSVGGYDIPAVGETCTRWGVVMVFQITGQNASINLGVGGTIPTGTTFGDLWVCRIPNSINK